MEFSTGTWWLVGVLATALIGTVTYLIKRALFARVDRCEALAEQCVKKDDYDKSIGDCKADIKQIRQDYTPRSVHTKDIDECRGDIKQIKEDYITREDFFREQGKVDRKLDRIMDILLEWKGGESK